MKQERRRNRFARRVFTELREHRRKITELEQEREQETSSQQYPNIELDPLQLTDTLTLQRRSDDAGFRFGDGYGYDYALYQNAGMWSDEFERDAIEDTDAGRGYRGEADYSILPEGGIKGRNAVVSEGTNQQTLHTDHAVIPALGGPGRKIVVHYRNDTDNASRRVLWNLVSGTGDGPVTGSQNHFYLDLGGGNGPFALGYRRFDNETELETFDGENPPGWTRVEVNHGTDYTEFSVQDIRPRSNYRENVAYGAVSHENPLEGTGNNPATDMGVMGEKGTVWDWFASA